MENNYGPNEDLRILLNKEYLAKTFLNIIKDVRSSKTPFYKLATKNGTGARFGRIGTQENRRNKAKGKWGKPK